MFNSQFKYIQIKSPFHNPCRKQKQQKNVAISDNYRVISDEYK